MAESALKYHVLILNKNWIVIGTSTVERAVVLLCRDSAKGVCPETFNLYNWEQWISEENPPKVDNYIKTPSMMVPAPQIIVLTKYDDVYCQDIKFHNKAIYRRDEQRCQYCGKKKKPEELSIDHVIPTSRGGPRISWTNCVTACFSCNNFKSDMTPTEAGMKLLRQPKKPVWSPVAEINKNNIPNSWKKLLKEDWLK